MKKLQNIKVHYQNQIVGEIADGIDETIFQYDPEFLHLGVELSPLTMPLREKPYLFDDPDFSTLAPLFSDSLPDLYGSKIMARWFEKERGSLYYPTVTDKLAYVGYTGLGALTYQPGQDYPTEILQKFDLHEQERLALSSVAQTADQFVNRLRRAARTAGGRFPKALLAIDLTTGLFFEDHPQVGSNLERWIIKFGMFEGERQSLNNYPNIEYAYHQMAKAIGIRISETRLIKSIHRTEKVDHFGIKRFDLKNGARFHMATLSALTGISPQSENLTYRDLFETTHQLTKNIQEIKEVFKRMVFNVLTCNADDHGKNHSFLFDGKKWELSPAYDLTFSDEGGIHHIAERSMSIGGERKIIQGKSILKEGLQSGLTKRDCLELYEQVAEVVSKSRVYLLSAGLPEKTVQWIERKIATALSDSKIPSL